MVSVIFATYNYGRFISEAIESLINQTYVDWECIIIDDGSTDNTKSVVDDWIKKDKRIIYISQQNAGDFCAQQWYFESQRRVYFVFRWRLFASTKLIKIAY